MIRRHLLTVLLMLATSRLLGVLARAADQLALAHYARAWDQACTPAPGRHRRRLHTVPYVAAVAALADTPDTLGGVA